MKKCLTTILALFASAAGFGDTFKVEATGYYVPLNEPEWIDLEHGREAFPNYRRHITAVRKDGRIESHWCSGTNVVSEAEFEGGGGHCTIFDEDGDVYWTWFRVDGKGSFEWQVMGRTGKYEGSSGSGVSTTVSTLPDGTAVFSIEGTIELGEN